MNNTWFGSLNPTITSNNATGILKFMKLDKWNSE